MKLLDLLTIIHDNQTEMIAKYPQYTHIIVEIHAKLVLAVEKQTKLRETP